MNQKRECNNLVLSRSRPQFTHLYNGELLPNHDAEKTQLALEATSPAPSPTQQSFPLLCSPAALAQDSSLSPASAAPESYLPQLSSVSNARFPRPLSGCLKALTEENLASTIGPIKALLHLLSYMFKFSRSPPAVLA